MVNKKILFVLPSLESGGAEHLILELLNSIKEEYNVYLLVLSNKIKLIELLEISKDNIFVLDGPFEYLSLKEIRLSNYKYIKEINEIVKNYKIDLVFTNLPISHFIFRIYKVIFPFSKIKLINIHHSLKYKSRKSNLVKKIFDFCNNLLSLLVDKKNIFVSYASYNDNKKNFFYRKDNVVIIYNGIKMPKITKMHNPFEKLNFSLDSYLIVFAGRLVPEKGHIFFLKSLEKLVKRKKIAKKIELFIIGDGPLKSEIISYTKTMLIKDSVHLLGNKPRNELINYFKYSNLVVIPSIAEGFGLISVESILSGANLLSSDAGGLKEIVTDELNGFSFRNNDKDSLEKKLINIINNNLRIDSTKAIKYTAEKFSFDVMLTEYKKVINEL